MEIRTARENELDDVEGFSHGFTTSSVFELVIDGASFRIIEKALDAPIRKVFPDDDGPSLEREDADVEILAAIDTDQIIGRLRLHHSDWNRRTTITDIEVAESHRKRGVGRQLLDHGARHARLRGSRTYWLEVTGVNAPAIRSYLAAGFVFCGFDATLYNGTVSEGETALFMAKTL